MKTTHLHNHHHHNNHQNKSPKQLKPCNKTTSLFSCAFFRHCAQSPLSPTTPHSSPPHLPSSLPLPPPSQPPPPPPLPPLHHPPKPPNSSSSSSSSSASHSFTQWRFPPTFPPPSHSLSSPTPPPPPPLSSDLHAVFRAAELGFAGAGPDRQGALQLLEHSLVPDPPAAAALAVPTAVMAGVVECMREGVGARAATKVLLALCLSEGNRLVAVECGAAARVVDALPDLEGAAAERALASLELMCTLPVGADQVRAHALAVPMLVAVMGRMEGRGKEYALGVLVSVYGGDRRRQLAAAAPPEEVARAVALAMQQEDCSARGKRKGAQLLKVLQEENGQLDLIQVE